MKLTRVLGILFTKNNMLTRYNNLRENMLSGAIDPQFPDDRRPVRRNL